MATNSVGGFINMGGGSGGGGGGGFGGFGGGGSGGGGMGDIWGMLGGMMGGGGSGGFGGGGGSGWGSVIGIIDDLVSHSTKRAEGITLIGAMKAAANRAFQNYSLLLTAEAFLDVSAQALETDYAGAMVDHYEKWISLQGTAKTELAHRGAQIGEGGTPGLIAAKISKAEERERIQLEFNKRIAKLYGVTYPRMQLDIAKSRAMLDWQHRKLDARQAREAVRLQQFKQGAGIVKDIVKTIVTWGMG